ncbi:aminoglycoside phosphotransferase family protein [Streptomyces sp. B6B3]|uniref:phosphotransferase family protein n=1 Tax=Streptomyces sp. B6B3 TaxID=3153570 RepID=UPI00325D1C10
MGSTDESGPMRAMLEWAAACVDDAARVVGVRALHAGDGPWLLRVESPRRLVEVVLRAPTPRIDGEMIATNVAALRVAEEHSLPAPRLLGADLDGLAAGVPASVETVVPGSSAWPARVGADRLRAAGAAIARVHRIPLAPSDHLPVRARPIAVDDFARERRLGRMPTTPLLRHADVVVRAVTAAGGPTVFLHGDVWPGNTMWSGAVCRALIDWKTAGVGSPGVDLGELRKQVALANGPDAPRHVLEGWERASGVRAEDVPYWDAVAALNTPTACDPPEHTAPRDSFLRAALARLE